MINHSWQIGAVALLATAAGVAQAGEDAFVVTASNTAANQLMIYSTNGNLLRSLPTQGQGGVGGNAGGIAVDRDHLAAVNYGSGNVTVFARDQGGGYYRIEALVQATGSPVSVAFGHQHLYVLTTTGVESHAMGPHGVAGAADGAAALLHADGSAAQVGVLDRQLVVSEKSNAIETVNLDARGAVVGVASLVGNLPANINAPFGLATRGDEAYVTIAHANEISLVRDNSVLTITGSGTQNAPCWVALDGPFLFSANSPSKSVSRYAVYGQKIVQDAAVVATFAGNPTDIAYRHGLAAVIDSDGTVSHVSIFRVDQDGNLTLNGSATIGGPKTNGVAVVATER